MLKRKTPPNVPHTPPIPPARLAPPITVDAIASVSIPLPALGCPVDNHDANMTPAKAASKPERIYATVLFRFIKIPDNHAAVLFPPIA